MDRQKIFLLFGAAWLSAALLTWFVYAKTTAPKAEKKVTIMAAVRDMPVGTKVGKTDLKQVSVLEKDLPKGSALKDTDALNRVALYPIAANEPLTDSKLSKTTGSEGVSATIDEGMRAISVQITDTSGVAGLVQPNSRVDVMFTRPGSMAEAASSTILQDVKVLAVGRLTQAGQTPDPKVARMPVVTLVVTPEDATKLELAKNQGKISLALRNPLDRSTQTNVTPVTTEVLDPMISARLARARRPDNERDRADPESRRSSRLAGIDRREEGQRRREGKNPACGGGSEKKACGKTQVCDRCLPGREAHTG